MDPWHARNTGVPELPSELLLKDAAELSEKEHCTIAEAGQKAELKYNILP